ncbi:hypothetical protein [Actinoplanes sp. NBRC 101535]|uniref:hypothetical protein n=1 Tax=Actinoplanes sp. NBRC 101535 TaxID=3032196 RepID=UPI002555206F|nr:hypothetical protein [Actinoplanes sp. NBRC 101535]
MARARVPWQAARKYVTPVAEGGLLEPGGAPPVLRTAPVGDADVGLWEECGCDYQRPSSGGRPVPQREDPAWAGWTEDPPKTAGTGRQSLRSALTRKPRAGDLGGLLGPNFYGLGHFHSGDSRMEQPGMPDLLLWSPAGRPQAWELKAMGKVPTWPQAVTMTSMAAAGFTVRLVRPCCLLSGWVDRWLAELAGRAPVMVSPWAGGPDRVAAPGAVVPRQGAVGVARPRVAGAVEVRRFPAPAPELPGMSLVEAVGVVDGLEGPCTGYLVPLPGGPSGQAVVEAWLRAAGFTPGMVPWPMRLVAAVGWLAVWVNLGPGAGRGWRVVRVESAVPERALLAMGGRAVAGRGLVAVAAAVLDARPDLPGRVPVAAGLPGAGTSPVRGR